MTVFELRKWLNKKVTEGKGQAEVYVELEDTHLNPVSACVSEENLFLLEKNAKQRWYPQ